MKKLIAYMILFCTPFLLMIAINELNRPDVKFKIKYFDKTGKAYNSLESKSGNCAWRCHNKGCDPTHFSKKSVLKNSDFINFMNKGIKKLNGKGSNIYSQMNILTLVVLWPLLMFSLLVINIELFFLRRKNRLKSSI